MNAAYCEYNFFSEYVSVDSVGVEEERELQNFDSVRNVRVACHTS